MDGAERIAQQNLLENCKPRTWKAPAGKKSGVVLLTGGYKYEEAWARDTGFSLPALQDPVVARNTLELFFDHQRSDGLLPRRISNMHNATRNVRAAMRKRGLPALPLFTTVKPEYTTGHINSFRKSEPKDSNPLLISAAAHYATTYDDIQFFTDYREGILKAIAYQNAQTTLGLVWQHVREDWADHTNREGRVFYTNLLAWRSIRDINGAFSKLANGVPRLEKEQAYRYDRIQTAFWDEELGYFINFIDSKQRAHRNFSIPENMLAITTGFATDEQRMRIINKLERTVNDHGYVPIVSPGYAAHLTPWDRKLFVGKYNTGELMIPWIQLLAGQALSRDRPQFAASLIGQVEGMINKYKTCLEVTERGEPMRMFLTDIEKRFTWTAAMYLLAKQEMMRHERPAA